MCSYTQNIEIENEMERWHATTAKIKYWTGHKWPVNPCITKTKKIARRLLQNSKYNENTMMRKEIERKFVLFSSCSVRKSLFIVPLCPIASKPLLFQLSLGFIRSWLKYFVTPYKWTLFSETHLLKDSENNFGQTRVPTRRFSVKLIYKWNKFVYAYCNIRNWM